MTRARLATGAAAVMALFILVPAAPASAAANVNVTIDSPASSPPLQNSGVQISGSGAIDRGGLGTNEITGVAIQVTGPQPAPSANPSCHGCGFSFVQGKPTTSFSFPTDLPYNGPYTATVTVTGTEYLALSVGGTPRSGSATRSFKLGVAPAPPHGVRVATNGDRSVTVTWAANPELDLTGYQVQGSDGSKSALIKPGSTLSWTDTQTTQTGGRYTYNVFVARTGADGPSGAPIASASNPIGVDVPAPPPPSTTADGGTVPPLIQSTPTSVGNGPSSNSGAPSLDLSGFLSKTPGASTPKSGTPALPKLVTPGEQVGPDTGFQPTLPFPVTAGRSGQGGKGGAGTPGALGQSAGSSHSTRRTILLPFAAGLFLCVVGIHVRWFNKRFGGDGTDPSLLPVEDVPTGGSDILPSQVPSTAPVGARPVLVGATARGAHRPVGDDPAPSPLDDESVLVTW